MTERLFDQSVDLLSFDATVLSCTQRDGAWWAVLDRTCFFPEGGGQGPDLGMLGGAEVLDVQEEAGEIRHRLSAPLSPRSAVHGEVDARRRLSMMQQHSGEHILSGLVNRLYGYRNVGFHIGTEAVTVDFDGPLTAEDLRRVELLANEAVWRDVPVRVWVPSPQELAGLQYRSKKAIDGDVRIVAIEGFDTCACCGTHVRTTGQIGAIRIVDAIRYKGGMRLSILCGMRALEHDMALQQSAREAARMLSAAAGDLPAAVARLQEEQDELKRRLAQLAMDAFRQRAAQDSGSGLRLVVADMLEARQLPHAAAEAAEGAQAAMVLCPSGTGWHYALCSASVDVRPLAQRLKEAFGGKGGGPKDLVQGLLSGGTPEEIRALLSKLV